MDLFEWMEGWLNEWIDRKQYKIKLPFLQECSSNQISS
jgi:hypothetical protein